MVKLLPVARLGIECDDGRDHCLMNVIQAMDHDAAVQTFLKDIPRVRQPFAISWITHVSYLAQKEEESGEPHAEVTERMRQKNIQVLVLSDDTLLVVDENGKMTEF